MYFMQGWVYKLNAKRLQVKGKKKKKGKGRDWHFLMSPRVLCKDDFPQWVLGKGEGVAQDSTSWAANNASHSWRTAKALLSKRSGMSLRLDWLHWCLPTLPSSLGLSQEWWEINGGKPDPSEGLHREESGHGTSRNWSTIDQAISLLPKFSTKTYSSANRTW